MTSLQLIRQTLDTLLPKALIEEVLSFRGNLYYQDDGKNVNSRVSLKPEGDFLLWTGYVEYDFMTYQKTHLFDLTTLTLLKTIPNQEVREWSTCGWVCWGCHHLSWYDGFGHLVWTRRFTHPNFYLARVISSSLGLYCLICDWNSRKILFKKVITRDALPLELYDWPVCFEEDDCAYDHLDISPDGRLVVYVARNPLRMVFRSTETGDIISTFLFPILEPRFHPLRTWLTYLSGPDLVTYDYVEKKDLFRLTLPCLTHRWSLDGKMLAITLFPEEKKDQRILIYEPERDSFFFLRMESFEEDDFEASLSLSWNHLQQLAVGSNNIVSVFEIESESSSLHRRRYYRWNPSAKEFEPLFKTSSPPI